MDNRIKYLPINILNTISIKQIIMLPIPFGAIEREVSADTEVLNK